MVKIGVFMKKFLKTLIAVMMAAMLVFSVTACKNIGGDEELGGVKYKKIDGVYTVYEYVQEEDVTVLDLGEALGDDIDNVRIKKGAFSGNSKLTKIIVPTSVTKIDKGAFEKMGALVTLELPFIGESANSDAYYAESKTAEGKAVDAARTIAYIFGTEEYDMGAPVTVSYDSKSSTTCYMPLTFREVIVNATAEYSIPMYAFNGAVNLTSIVLKGKVDAIGQYAFAGCKELTAIELPETVVTVYENAFENCAKLKSLTVKAATITVKDGAFLGTKLARTALDGKVADLNDAMKDKIFGEVE